MARTIIITCGTSLYTASAWQDPPILRGPALSSLKHQERHRQEAIYEDFTRQFPNPAALAANFAKQCWDDINLVNKLSAELASLRSLAYYYESRNPALPLGTGDRAIFYHNDDPEGFFCATCLKKILIDNTLLAEAAIDFRSLPSLDPQCPQAFQDALRNLWTQAHTELTGLPSDNRVILNLTGGYKAMGFVLAALAALLAPPVPPLTVIYLYESTRPGQLHALHWSQGSTIPISQILLSGFYDPLTHRSIGDWESLRL